jgi:hypothetical protein
VGETGFGGIVVSLFDAANNLVATTLTNANGEYQFALVAMAQYSVRFSEPEGYDFSAKDQGTDDSVDSDVNIAGQTDLFWLTAGQTLDDLDAGLVQLT